MKSLSKELEEFALKIQTNSGAEKYLSEVVSVIESLNNRIDKNR
jgi:hypothetical protein